MRPDSRISSLIVEMLGSAAICGMAFVTDRILGVHRRRHASA